MKRKLRMMGRLERLLLSIAIVGLVSASVGVAIADACGSQGGTYTSNERRALAFSMTNYSQWMSDWTYNADRVRSDNSIAYHEYVVTQDDNRYWSFTNSIDVFRSTQIQRGGYGDAYWWMEQWAQGPC